MNANDIGPWSHQHSFGQEHARHGERRTRWVVGLTAVMMVLEIVAGVMFGSMALLADGLHMASHTVALGLALFAYVYARRHAHDSRFSLGTGKVNALGGFSGALLLAVFAVFMAVESVDRFLHPVAIFFDQALVVASVGLVVNVVSALLLKHEPHGHDEHHGAHGGHSHRGDYNLRSAYLHVLADALTSVAAIVALLAGKLYGWAWMDPTMGLVGSVLVAVWAWTLMRASSHVLLDHQAPAPMIAAIRSALEHDSDDRVSDLHIWSIGPGIWAAVITLVTAVPRQPQEYKAAIPESLGVVHATVEVHRRD